MDLTKLFGMMNDYKDAKVEMIDKTYENIKGQANEGNKDAKTILNFGSEKEVRLMINQSLNR